MLDTLNALSPLDGKYLPQVKDLTTFFSEAALIKARVKIEILYFLQLYSKQLIPTCHLTSNQLKDIKQLLKPLNSDQLQRVKQFEEKTHHDVKAIEYFIAEYFTQCNLARYKQFIHFGLTSEDVNNLAYRLLITQALQQVVWPVLNQLINTLNTLIDQTKNAPILARTHGQPAVPTTFGKELAVFAQRSLQVLDRLINWQATGKFGGSVGAHQALVFVLPKVDWAEFSATFIQQLGFKPLGITTQINPNDDLVELFQIFQHLNQILLGLNQDLWHYISDDWLCQKGKEEFVGSSTMPQKINPIEFENSEGNLVLANAIFSSFIEKLSISRLQRDLSGSTISRNFGVAFGHCLLAYKNLTKGLNSLATNPEKIQIDLMANWVILSEALQTTARLQGNSQAYEQLAKQVRGKKLDQAGWQKLVQVVKPPLKKQLAQLTPQTYLGLSSQITKDYLKQSKKLQSKWQASLVKKRKHYEQLFTDS